MLSLHRAPFLRVVALKLQQQEVQRLSTADEMLGSAEISFRLVASVISVYKLRQLSSLRNWLISPQEGNTATHAGDLLKTQSRSWNSSTE
jgi:hypothetical protein